MVDIPDLPEGIVVLACEAGSVLVWRCPDGTSPDGTSPDEAAAARPALENLAKATGLGVSVFVGGELMVIRKVPDGDGAEASTGPRPRRWPA